MKLLRHLSIKNKLTAIILVVSSVVVLTGFTVILIRDIFEARTRMVQSIIIQTLITARYSVTPLLSGDRNEAEDTIRTLSINQNITNVFIIGLKDTVFASYNRENMILGQILPVREVSWFFEDGYLHVKAPITYENILYGVVYVRATTAMLALDIRERIAAMLLLWGGLILLSILLANRLQRVISYPISRLAEVTRTISRDNDYSIRAVKTNEDEIGVLIDGFNGMLDRIQNRERALRSSEERFRALTESTTDWIWEIDTTGTFIYSSPKVYDLLGFRPTEVIGKSFLDFVENKDIHHETFMALIDSRRPFAGAEYDSINKNGQHKILEKSGVPVFDHNGIFTGFRGIDRDITERKTLESHVIQSQKIESLGRLAGGVAHDFNNMLTAIIGNTEFALMNIEKDSPLVADLEEILYTSNRAANLTHQLLAFSRRQIIEPRVLNINESLTGMSTMLRRLIGEDIEMITVPEEGLWSVKIDPGQFEQVLTNLVVNARDAMPEGGKLTIETANVYLDEEYSRHHADTHPGEYIMFAVSDNGSGIDKETLAHIFEPFFTTKEKGKGTGLGLSTCYGIVKQNNGNIWVYSEPGLGTSFKVYLPRVLDNDIIQPSHKYPHSESEGSETILVVEDEDAVRNMIQRILEQQGYNVVTATNGVEAIQAAEAQKSSFDLVVTDVIMPQLGGKKLAEMLRKSYTGIKVLFISGYTDNAIVHNSILEEGLSFMQKPFSPTEFVIRVREMLDTE